MMEFVRDFTVGISDAFAWPACFVVLYGSKRLQSRILQSCLINGGIFLGSVLAFEALIKLNPAFSFKEGWLMSSLYYFLWVYPIFVASLLLSNRIYRDIGHDAYIIFLGAHRKDKKSSVSQSVFSPIAVQGYYWILLGTMILQAKLLHQIPIIGHYLSFLLFSVITAWYSFEYAWNSLNYTLEKRVQILEEHWIYFIGFGAPLTLMTFFSPFALNQGIFALLFPFYVIMANKATPHIFKLSQKKRLPFLQPAIGLINRFLRKSLEKID